jgi:hypothetical protein
MAKDSGFRDIKRKPKPGWERWQPPQPDRWARAGFRGKTVWDWLDLLIVPLMLALITVGFAWQQDARQNHIEDQRAKAERELVDQRAQDEAVQAYLDQMSNLLLEKDLRETSWNNEVPTLDGGSEVQTVARARTISVLPRLDPSRKTVVMHFLGEADLLGATYVRGELSKGPRAEEKAPVLSLAGANLSGAGMEQINLSEADLSYANLHFADLSIKWVGSLKGATMPNGQKYADWLKDRERKENGADE